MEAINDFSARTLSHMDIHQLRDMARALGVASPTSKKKEILIEDILAIVYGKAVPDYKNSNRGRPAKNNYGFGFATNPGHFATNPGHFASNSGVSAQTYGNFMPTAGFYGYSFGVGLKVASPGQEYIVDGRSSNLHGVVTKVDDEYFLRKYSFMASPGDIRLSRELVERYNLKPNDAVNYVRDEDGNPVILNVVSSTPKTEPKKIGDIVLGKRNLAYVNGLNNKQKLLADLAEIDQIVFMPSNAVSQFGGKNVMIMPLTEYSAREMINSFFACCDVAGFYRSMGKSVVLISDNMLNILTALKQFPAKESAELERRVQASIEKLVTQDITFIALIPSIIKNVANDVLKMFDNEVRL